MKPLDRASLHVLLLACAALALAAGFLWLHLIMPFDGVRLQPGGSVWQSNGVLVTPIREQTDGLRAGDHVVAVDGRSMEDWARMLFQVRVPRPQWQIGETITYTVERDGQLIDLRVTLDRYPVGTILAREWGTILFALVSFAIAVFVFLRRHTNAAAQILFLWASSILAATTWSIGLHVGDIIGGHGFWLYKATTFGAYVLFWIAGLHFTLIFPQRHPLVARFRWLIPTIYIVPYLIVFVYLAATRPTAASVLDWIGGWGVIEGVLSLVFLVGMIGMTISQYRRSRGTVARQKIRWVVFATFLSGGGSLLLWNIPGLVLGYGIIDANALGLLLLPFPIAIAIAIVRYQLFDIDTIITRTLVYGTLTGSVISIYVLIVGYLGTLFRVQDNLFISLIATGVVAVLFQPLRERIQRVVNRLMYGDRDEPYAVISRLGERLEATIAPDSVLPTIVQTIKDALKLPYVAIALPQHHPNGANDAALADRQSPVVAVAGTPVVDPFAIGLTYQHETVGHLLLGHRAPNETFGPADRRLLSDLARQAGVAVHAVQLTTDLQRSRERLVTAREEERRRLRRDLHDGLGPTLASLTMKLETAEMLVQHDLHEGVALLHEIQGQMKDTITNVRRLVYGLRPPVLDQFGLLGAIRESALQIVSADLDLRLDVPDHLPSLPAAVEVAAYYIVVEALTNSVRHAHAHQCMIRLSVDHALRIEVADDGVGLPQAYAAGVGLQSMRDRAAELGGTCVIQPGLPCGTSVHATIPF